MKTICVYCGSKTGNDPDFRRSATLLGKRMARQGIGLVYGGANIGLMGTIADAVLQDGGEVIGIIPRDLFREEVIHPEITQQIMVDNMHQRKEKMAALADGFIAMPGGFGTFEELFEAITWNQLGIQNKPVGMLNVNGYYDSLSVFIDHAVDQGFIHPRHRSLYMIEHDPEKLIDELMSEYTGRTAPATNS